jgi:ribokinase
MNLLTVQGRVKFVACVGDDLFGRNAIEGFRADGIDISSIKTDAASPSGVALIFVDDKGENSIAVASGANNSLAPADIGNAASLFEDASIVLIQLETPIETVRAVLDMAEKNNVPVILNPAPAQKLDDELLAKVSIITPNETEAEILTGIKVSDAASAGDAAQALQSKGIKTVIITMGSKGAFVMNHKMSAIVESYKVDAVDTTAAGDTFNGVLAAQLAEKIELPDAVKFANAAAALSVTVSGAQPSVPTREAVVAFMK